MVGASLIQYSLSSERYNLNSVEQGPQRMSATYVEAFLATMISERYTVFAVIGNLPDGEMTDFDFDPEMGRGSHGPGHGFGQHDDDDDDDLQRALAMSLDNPTPAARAPVVAGLPRPQGLVDPPEGPAKVRIRLPSGRTCTRGFVLANDLNDLFTYALLEALKDEVPSYPAAAAADERSLVGLWIQKVGLSLPGGKKLSPQNDGIDAVKNTQITMGWIR